MSADRIRVQRLIDRTGPAHPARLADIRARAARRERQRRSAPMGTVASTVLVAALALVLVVRSADRHDQAASSVVSGAYAAFGLGGTRLLPISAATLADDPSRATVELDDPSVPGTPQILASADGSTVIIAPADRGGGLVRVLDARTGAQRTRFRAPLGHFAYGLSADGSRLLLYEGGSCREDGCAPAAFRVLDTASGREVGAMRAAEPWRRWWGLHLSPDGRSLYALLLGGDPSDAATVAAYDVASGRETGSVRMDGLAVGYRWGAGRSTMAAEWRPGSALSPDGRTLAVVHADRAALTLVDTRGLWSRTIAVPGLPASPPPSGGAELWAAFSPDGTLLYAGGVRREEDARGAVRDRGLGIRAMDARSGRVLAHALEGRAVGAVSFAGGGSLFVSGSEGESSGCPCTIYRLEARGLAVEAQRRFERPAAVRISGTPLGRAP